MAFLVCYSETLADHAINKAIYLDHSFYKLIFKHCRSSEAEFSVLSSIANLRYKSPSILISAGQTNQLSNELKRLIEHGNHHHQTNEFNTVCENAKSKKTNLTVSGDMFPELEPGLMGKLRGILKRI